MVETKPTGMVVFVTAVWLDRLPGPAQRAASLSSRKAWEAADCGLRYGCQCGSFQAAEEGEGFLGVGGGVYGGVFVEDLAGLV